MPRRRKRSPILNGFGCHVIHVLAEGDEPPFSYSVGIQRTATAPEVIIVGLKREISHFLVNEYNERVRAGERFAPGRFYAGFLENFEVTFESVDREHYRGHLGWARWLYDGDEFEVLQLVYPTTSGVWPWGSRGPGVVRPAATAPYRERRPRSRLTRRCIGRARGATLLAPAAERLIVGQTKDPIGASAMPLSPAQRTAIDHVAAQARSRQPEALAQQDHIRRMCDLSADELRDALVSIRRRARVALHFHPDRPDAAGQTVAQALLRDGLYRSQFETGLSNGGLSAHPGGRRDLCEQLLFGGAYHSSGTTNAERPKYGSLTLLRHADGPSPPVRIVLLRARCRGIRALHIHLSGFSRRRN